MLIRGHEGQYDQRHGNVIKHNCSASRVVACLVCNDLHITTNSTMTLEVLYNQTLIILTVHFGAQSGWH